MGKTVEQVRGADRGEIKLERMLSEFADDAAVGLRIGVALQILRMYEISGDTLQSLP